MARPSKPWFWAAKGVWVCTINGKRVKLGVQGEENEQQAVEAWHRKMAGLETPKPESRSGLTVREVVTRYLADCEGRVKPKTVAWYKDFLDQFTKRHGDLPATDLTTVLVESYSRKPQWSSSTRHAFLGTVIGAFRWAEERARIIDRNPIRGTRKPPKASRGLEAVIAPEEHERLVEAATPSFRLVLRILWATGARPGEVVQIDGKNFDPDTGAVRLKEHKTSHHGKTRNIYLPGDIVDLLRGQREKYPTGPLLRNERGRPWAKRALAFAMEATQKRSGLEGKILYGYRHTFATDALANGIPEAHVAELLGHCSTIMLHRHYSHLSGRVGVLRSALQRVRTAPPTSDGPGVPSAPPKVPTTTIGRGEGVEGADGVGT